VGKEKLEGKRKKLAFIKRDRITQEVEGAFDVEFVKSWSQWTREA